MLKLLVGCVWFSVVCMLVLVVASVYDGGLFALFVASSYVGGFSSCVGRLSML